MINASGWIPPQGFDLTQRPWYLKAAETGKLIYTDAFLNASNDHLIVTVAAPYYDHDDNLIGVVAGDILLDSIIRLVNNQSIDNDGFSFLVDGHNNILAHPHLNPGEKLDLMHISDLSTELVEILGSDSKSVQTIILDDVEGYLAFEEMPETSWKIASFIPSKQYLTAERQLFYTFLFALFSMTMIMLVSALIQRKHLIKPMIDFDNDIKRIALDSDLSYRLPAHKADIFSPLRYSINSSLEKTETIFTALVLSEKRNRAILDVHPDLIFLINHDGYFLDYQFNTLDKPVHFNQRDFIGKHISEVMPTEIAVLLLKTLNQAISDNEIQTIDYTMTVNGAVQYYETRLVNSSADTILAIVRNVTEERLNQLLIETLSYRDQLTGLYNRRFYEEELHRLDTNRNIPISLILLDVNGLKLTNDAFGHQLGDALLKRVAEVVSDCCRTEDILARIGGDEFVILLPKTSSADTEVIVNRIYENVNKEMLGSVKISVSIGFDTKMDMNQNMKDVFTRAEDRMYQRKLHESQRMRYQTVHAILQTLNESALKEEEHSKNISRISIKIGEAYGMDQEKLVELELAGLMHDIGKIAVDMAILNKKSGLSESEYIEVKRHSEIGYQILKSVDKYTSLAEIVLHHHERWDGKGYPYGLAGEEIPLLSRIITIADTYEAIRSVRPYRLGRSHDEALIEIQKHSGTQFDPKLVDIFIKLDGSIVSPTE
jgi:diguanylate cyclase (GGDEF)-like protein